MAKRPYTILGLFETVLISVLTIYGPAAQALAVSSSPNVGPVLFKDVVDVSKKKCTKCGEVKSLEQFSKQRIAKDGKHSWCEECRRKYKKRYYIANSAKIRKKASKYLAKNHVAINERRKKAYRKYRTIRLLEMAKYRASHKEEMAEYQKQYRQANVGKRKEYAHKYYAINKEHINAYRAEYYATNCEKIKNRQRQYYALNQKMLQKEKSEYGKTERGRTVMKRKSAKRKRELGFNPLNEAFKDSVWHHVDDLNVVAIPRDIHVKFGGLSREIHRRKVMECFGSLEAMISGNIKKGVCNEVSTS